MSFSLMQGLAGNSTSIPKMCFRKGYTDSQVWKAEEFSVEDNKIVRSRDLKLTTWEQIK